MKKPTEKPPIDELFARKLGNMSLPPSPDGFERLQARMGQHKPQTRVVSWRNADIQRYMAVAACLLLVSLFGWLYWPSGKSITSNEPQMATNQSTKSYKTAQPKGGQSSGRVDVDAAEVTAEKSMAQQAAMGREPSEDKNRKDAVASQSAPAQQVNKSAVSEYNESTVAQTVPGKKSISPDAPIAEVQPAVEQLEQVADNKAATKPKPAQVQASERVLDVTIAEPEALVAARQVATEAVQEKSAVAAVEKQPKETRGFWQQVSRIKQGEVFARHTDPANEERGLLGRAYSGLRQSFDKDKSSKQ